MFFKHALAQEEERRVVTSERTKRLSFHDEELLKIQCNIYFGYFFLRLYFEYENGMINIIYKKIVTIQ